MSEIAEAEPLERASRALFGLTVQAMRDAAGENVTPAGLQGLLVLANLGSCTVTEMSARTGLSHSGASRMVDRLVADRLVRRGTPAEDRRRVRLELTSAGRRLTGRIARCRRAAITVALERMHVDDRARLLRGMTAFAAAVAASAAPTAEDDRGRLKEFA